RSGAAEVERAGGVPELVIPHGGLGRARIPVALATDNKPRDPCLAVRVAGGRRDMTSGQVLGPSERPNPLPPLRAFTGGGAWRGLAEAERGMLAPGKLADLAVLDRDPLAAPLDSLHELSCNHDHGRRPGDPFRCIGSPAPGCGSGVAWSLFQL